MITSFEINNFKKYSNMKFGDFSKINLFVGVNNVGKTTVLEALLGFACGSNLTALLPMTLLHRTNEQIVGKYYLAEAIWNLFHNNKSIKDLNFSFSGCVNDALKKIEYKFQPTGIFSNLIPNDMGLFDETNLMLKQQESQPIEFSINGQMGINRQVLGKLSVKIDGKPLNDYSIEYPLSPFPETHVSPLMLGKRNDIMTHALEYENRVIFSAMSRAGVMKEVISCLNKSFSEIGGIESLENIPYPDGSQAPISVRLKNGRILPLYSMGDGIRRWINIIGGMVAYKNAIHCIEEIDATFHHKAQDDLTSQIIKYAKKFDNQLFMTTHNAEYLNSFLKTISLMDDGEEILKGDIRVITLRNVKGEICERTLDGKDALYAIEQGLELRL